MRKKSLKLAIVYNFLSVILFMSISIGVLGFYVIREDVLKNVQHQVSHYMRAARILYGNMASSIGMELSLLTRLEEIEEIRKKTGLDYLCVVEKKDFDKLSSELALKATKGVEISGTRVIHTREISERVGDLSKRLKEKFSKYDESFDIASVFPGGLMAIEYARPVYGQNSQVERVLYGGKIINADNSIVDNIRDVIFGEELYVSKPIGTVTIFHGDVRIATNVIKADGTRALGTKVSKEVHDHVIIRGKTWSDRALVVDDWYITSYEPIKDINGETIGMLYVGILEQPFFDTAKRVFKVFFVIVLGALVLAVIISFLLAGAIVRPVMRLVKGTTKISKGELDHRIDMGTAIEELKSLEISFNNMAKSLDERNHDLVQANKRTEALNKRYLDLISFVSHELKGILASTILNAYSVRDGFLGMVNFKQQKALDSVTRNLDHLDATVKNFLNLSRIERGSMEINKRPVLISEDIFSVAIDTFMKQMSEKEIELENNLPADLTAEVDRDLLQIVANNLVSNAVKYGARGGRIRISADDVGDRVRVSVYNDGRVLTEEERGMLFRRFSRLDSPETKKAKGTGLGLFISKEIIEKHGGTITVQPGKKGNSFIFDINKGG